LAGQSGRIELEQVRSTEDVCGQNGTAEERNTSSSSCSFIKSCQNATCTYKEIKIMDKNIQQQKSTSYTTLGQS